MDNNILWAPWRSAFVLAEKEEGCPLCNAFEADKDSVENLIVYRGQTCFVILIKFPYNSGHAMVCPNRHLADLDKLTAEESAEMFALVQTTVGVIQKVINPHSFNIGMNINRCAGAGLPEHLHIHLVPRWDGDTNFMSVCSDTDVISQSLTELLSQLKKVSKEQNLPGL